MVIVVVVVVTLDVGAGSSAPFQGHLLARLSAFNFYWNALACDSLVPVPSKFSCARSIGQAASRMGFCGSVSRVAVVIAVRFRVSF